MGTYYQSSVRLKHDPDLVERDLHRINEDLWGTTYRVERVKGLPVTPQDTRQAFWTFTHTDPAIHNGDAAFSVVDGGDGRLEFKVPRSQWDESWRDQQKVRRRLVRKYNAEQEAM